MRLKRKSKKDKSNILRIASYNILHGGKGRLDSISKVIKKINPDICGVLEAVGWQEKGFTQKMAKKLGYDFSYLALANSKYNIAIFSKIILKTKTIKVGFRHVVLQATIKYDSKKEINFFFVHFSPVSEDERIFELNKLLKITKKLKNVIIMGDFNSLSPNDP